MLFLQGGARPRPSILLGLRVGRQGWEGGRAQLCQVPGAGEAPLRVSHVPQPPNCPSTTAKTSQAADPSCGWEWEWEWEHDFNLAVTN